LIVAVGAVLAAAGVALGGRSAAAAPRRMAGVLPLASMIRSVDNHRHRHRRQLVAAVGVAAMAGVVSVLAVGVVGAVGAASLFGGAAAVALAMLRARKARERTETRAGVVDLCRAMAAELRAGRPSAEAFAAAAHGAPARLSDLLRSAVSIGRRGDMADLADTVAAAARSSDCSGLSRIVACWRVAAASGAALAPAIDRVADALQDEIDVARDVTSTLAGPRATVQLLACLPLIGLLLGTAIGASPADFLLRSGPGAGCLVVAIALDAAGVVWARRIAARAARVG
jgi:tight adherence protein B